MIAIRTPTVLILCVVCTIGLGCKSQSRIEKARPAIMISATMPAESSAVASELLPLRASQQQYMVWTGELADARQTETIGITTEPASEFASQWSRTEGESRKEFLSVDAQGNILLHAVIEYGDKAVSQFSPPLVVAFADMPAGVERRSESKMRVVDLDNRLKQKEIGTALRTITYADDQFVRTTVGEHRAKRLIVHFTADLKLAEAQEHTTMWLVPGVGVVAAESREEIKVLGLAGKTRHRILTLTEAPSVTTSAEPASTPN